jgi:hypothetical protein
VHAFNLFTVAERDLAKLRALHAEFFERLRALVAGSQPPERVVLYTGQLVALDEFPLAPHAT